MTNKRNLDYESAETGAAWAKDVDDTVNNLSGKNLDRLLDVSGTNDLTGTLLLSTGFTSITNGAKCSLVPPNNNNGAMTLQLQDASTSPPENLDTQYPIRRGDGTATEENDIVGGRLLSLEFNSTDAYWRVISQISYDSSDVGTQKLYTFVDCIRSSETWIAPHDCQARIWVIAAGGSGAATNGGSGRAGGGGAGQVVRKDVTLSASDELVITIGAQGAGVSHNSDGSDAGNTTVTGPDSLSLTAEGGKGGTHSVVGADGPGGAGGNEASHGGDEAFSGGDGGDATGQYTGGGGGACGLWKNGNDADDNPTDNTGTLGAGLDDNETVTRFLASTMYPFMLDGAKGGVEDGGVGGNFCGGGGGGHTSANGVTASDQIVGSGSGGLAAHTGGCTTGDGGVSFVIIEFSVDTA